MTDEATNTARGNSDIYEVPAEAVAEVPVEVPVEAVAEAVAEVPVEAVAEEAAPTTDKEKDAE